MITITKTKLEKELNKQLTNNEYMQYIYKLNFGSKKQTHKNAQTKITKTTKAPLKFEDAKTEYLKVNNFDVKCFDVRYYEYFLKFGDYFLGFKNLAFKLVFVLVMG